MVGPNFVNTVSPTNGDQRDVVVSSWCIETLGNGVTVARLTLDELTRRFAGFFHAPDKVRQNQTTLDKSCNPKDLRSIHPVSRYNEVLSYLDTVPHAGTRFC